MNDIICTLWGQTFRRMFHKPWLKIFLNAVLNIIRLSNIRLINVTHLCSSVLKILPEFTKSPFTWLHSVFCSDVSVHIELWFSFCVSTNEVLERELVISLPSSQWQLVGMPHDETAHIFFTVHNFQVMNFFKMALWLITIEPLCPEKANGTTKNATKMSERPWPIALYSLNAF